ncbi:MAG: hypothetical protein WC340_17030 [Kiritimatiellia bacterium]|jgi:hypothetical protein
MSIKIIWAIPSIGTHEINYDSIEDLRLQIEFSQIVITTIFDIGGTYEIIADSIDESQKAAEYMSQLKQAHDIVITTKTKSAQNIAKVCAPGCKVVLVQSYGDMRRASIEVHDAEGISYTECSSCQKGLTTPKGTIIVNLGATEGTIDLINTFKREAARSAFIKAGLTTLMRGRCIDDLGVELQKIGVIPRGLEGMAAFIRTVGRIKKTSAEKGITLTDADAVEEVLAIMNQGFWGVMSQKFGDGVISFLAGKEKSKAKNFRDARRIVASILHGNKSPDIRLYGDPNIWRPTP